MAFQCLNVWKCILRSRRILECLCESFAGLLKRLFSLILASRVNTCVLCLGRAFIISMSVGLTFHILGFEPFSGALRVIMFFSRSMSVHSNRFASPERMAVSFRICMKAAFFLPEPAISASISCSVGMKGNLRVTSHLGLFQAMPLNLRKSVYAVMAFLFRAELHFCSLANASLTLTVSSRFAPLSIKALRQLLFTRMVSLAYPSCCIVQAYCTSFPLMSSAIFLRRTSVV